MMKKILVLVLFCTLLACNDDDGFDFIAPESQTTGSIIHNNVDLPAPRTVFQSVELWLLSAAMDLINLNQDTSLNSFLKAAFQIAGVAINPDKADEEITIAGINNLVFRSTETTTKSILYIHGGGYVDGFFPGHFQHARQLSDNNNADVFLPDYTLSEGGVYPTALNEILGIYQALIASVGVRPEDIVLAGDSSGAHAILSLLRELKQQQIDMPAGVILYSPWGDLTATSSSYKDNLDTDVLVSPDFLARISDEYFGASGFAYNSPEISPVFSSFDNFPPMLVFASEDEILEGDADLIFQVAKRDQVDVTYIKYSVINGLLVHAWMAVIPTGQVADDVNQEIKSFLEKVF